MSDTRHCNNGNRCQQPDPTTGLGHPSDSPLCPACLTTAEPDIRSLLYDYLDLAQMHEPALNQAPADTSSGSKEPPMPLAGHIDALQAEIVHAVSLWEHALRAVNRLHNPHTFRPLWQARVYDHINLTTGTPTIRHARGGAIIQRALTVITPRLDQLSRLPAITVCPTGIEDQPTPMAGWEAVQHLQNLHHRARATLGRTTRKMWIYGDCWACTTRHQPDVDGPLWRAEPTRPEDPMHVVCAHCAATRPYGDYEQYMTTLQWPETVGAAA